MPSLAQGNLICFDPELESRGRANVNQDSIMSTSQGIPCAQTMPESLIRAFRLVQSWKPALFIKFRFSQYDRNRSDTEETSVWRPFFVRESNTGYVDPQLGRRGSVVGVEGTRLASSMHSPCMAPLREVLE